MYTLKNLFMLINKGKGNQQHEFLRTPFVQHQFLRPDLFTTKIIRPSLFTLSVPDTSVFRVDFDLNEVYSF